MMVVIVGVAPEVVEAAEAVYIMVVEAAEDVVVMDVDVVVVPMVIATTAVSTDTILGIVGLRGVGVDM